MGPRDHRIHLGRMDSLKTPPENHSSTKLFLRTMSSTQKGPQPKMLTQPSKISPEADFGNFSKSLQKERTAIFSEILSRIHPSTFQTEPRGEKHIFVCFHPVAPVLISFFLCFFVCFFLCCFVWGGSAQDFSRIGCAFFLE